jgi:sodium/bile acid cotransporter 7
MSSRTTALDGKMRLDPFLILMIAAVAMATAFPATGTTADVVDWMGTVGVALLFFRA